MDDLAPSGRDKRPAVQCGVPGASVCQIAPDFTLPDSLGNSVTLTQAIATPGVRGVVLYFTMWCPICVNDMSGIANVLAPQYPNVRFYAVDYVSGSVALARASELANFPNGFVFTVLADTQQHVLGLYQASMASTVVIDKNGVVRMNEIYKFSRLQSALAALP